MLSNCRTHCTSNRTSSRELADFQSLLTARPSGFPGAAPPRNVLNRTAPQVLRKTSANGEPRKNRIDWLE